MSKIILRVVLCIALFTGIAITTPATARADDPNMQDYNTYMQVAADPTPPSPSSDYNTYWAESQAKQQ
jgi:hypothetical protein